MAALPDTSQPQGIDGNSLTFTLKRLLTAANEVALFHASIETTDILAGGGAVMTPKFAAISATAAGDTTIVAAVGGKRIRVLDYTLVTATATAVSFKSSGGAALTGPMSFGANGGASPSLANVGKFQTAAGEGLVLNLGTAAIVGGHLTYVEY